jgi:hypothetical protein
MRTKDRNDQESEARSARDSATPHAGHSQTNLTPVAGLPCVPGPAGPDKSQHLADLGDDGALSAVAPA